MKIEDVMPDEGFFPEYLRYARTRTDAPDLFHLGAALATFSAYAAHKASMPYRERGKLTETPTHLWTLLVGESGGARKSTAIDIALGVFKPYGIAIATSPERTLREWAADEMDKRSALLGYPEATPFFERIRSSSWSGGAGLLPAIHDGSTVRRILVGSRRTRANPHPAPIEQKIVDPRIAFLGGITSESLDRATRRSPAAEAVLARMLVLYAERERFNPLPPSSTRNPDYEQGMANFAGRCLRYPGPQGLHPETWKLFRKWARKLDREISTGKEWTPRRRALARRLPNQVLRIIALYYMSVQGTRVEELWWKPVPVVQKAIALGEVAKESILKVVPA